MRYVSGSSASRASRAFPGSRVLRPGGPGEGKVSRRNASVSITKQNLWNLSHTSTFSSPSFAAAGATILAGAVAGPGRRPIPCRGDGVLVA